MSVDDKNRDMEMHVRGTSVFVDDIPAGECLHAALFTSPVARGRIKALDIKKAVASAGVEAVYTWRDVPGINQVGHIFKDHPLLAEESVEYCGQPIAMVVASTRKKAYAALKLISCEIEESDAVFSPREAAEKGMIYGQKRVLETGDTESAYNNAVYKVAGSIESGGQEHFYFETQRAIAFPKESGTIKVCASAQSPGAFHKHIAEVLGIPQNKVEFEIRRLGGGFGGKESTAVWCAAPALAAFLLNKPVKLVLSRNEDIATTGKRHPYQYDYKIGLDAEGRIVSYEVELYQQAGACADISTAVLGRSFLHASGAYYIPNIKVTALSCRTNIPPNNAFRGFGVPQAFFCIEAAMAHVAEVSGINPAELKRINLLNNGDTMPYGLKLKQTNIRRCWEKLEEKVDIGERFRQAEEYNSRNENSKMGLAVIPVCFGISFAQTALNQAGALVNIYVDGSVSVSTGAVEMGQGVNSKIRLIAASTLGINPEKVRIDTTNTSRVPNASPTSASTGADLNGMAAKYACEELKTRLEKFAAEYLDLGNDASVSIKNNRVYNEEAPADLGWEELVAAAQWARIDLSCHAFYATPGISLDPATERGRPFAYYSYGVSLTQVILDAVRGTYVIDEIWVVQDVGRSISPVIDRGQVEGAVIQGMGWAVMEQLRYDSAGRLLTGASSYKIPDIKFCPEKFSVYFLENSDNPYAVCNSKAVGEPPFLHGLGAYYALLNAVRYVRKDKPFPSLPLTPEKIFMYINS